MDVKSILPKLSVLAKHNKTSFCGFPKLRSPHIAKPPTNIIEGFNRQIRKVTKTKGNFTSEVALMKLLYVATKNIDKKWNSPISNWKLIAAQFTILFEGRFELEKSLQCINPRPPDY